MTLSFDPNAFELINTKASLTSWTRKLNKSRRFCLDTETTGLDVFSDKLVGIALAVEGKNGIDAGYIPIRQHSGKNVDTKDALAVIEQACADHTISVLFHNALYDLAIFSQPENTLYINNVHDSMLMAYALFGKMEGFKYIGSLYPGLGMDYLAKRFLNWDTIKFSQVVTDIPGRNDFRDVPLSEAVHYAAEDTAVTLVLGLTFQELLRREPSLRAVYNRDRAMLPAINAMKMDGVKVDVPLLNKLTKDWSADLDKIEKEAHVLAGTQFNLNSSQQVITVLEARGIEIPHDRKSGKQSVDKDHLEDLPDDELIDLIRAYKGKAKLVSTYTRALPTKIREHSGHVHCNFNVTATSTGRLSSSDPNLQNIPSRTDDGKLLRNAFIADKGHEIWSADYSQIEYRILAHITMDEYLLYAFRNGIDLHAKMAADVKGNGTWEDYANKKDGRRYGIRTAFKNVNFATIYGAGPNKIAKMSKIDVNEAYDLLDRHAEMAPGVYTWKDEVLEFARKNMYVDTLFGRRIHLPNILSRNQELRGHAERLAINGVIQGSAADFMRLGLVRVYDDLSVHFPTTARVRLQVHDELDGVSKPSVTKKVLELVKEGMETCADHLVQWEVPIVAEVSSGPTWGAAK